MTSGKLTLVRRDLDATISVYQGRRWLGFVYCPVFGPPAHHTDFVAAPENAEAAHGFTTEQAAIDHLVAAAP